MLYTILCYHNEDITSSWTEEEDAEVIECLKAVNRKWAKNFEPIVRLMPTSAATTLRKTENMVVDGPFAGTKDLIAGFWLWQVKDLEEAVAWVKRCPNPHPDDCEIEIRPVFEADDFGEALTPELREQEARVMAAAARNRAGGA